MTRRAGRPEVEPPFGNDFGNRFKRGLKEKNNFASRPAARDSFRRLPLRVRPCRSIILKPPKLQGSRSDDRVASTFFSIPNVRVMTRRAGRPEVDPPFGDDFGNRFKRRLKEKNNFAFRPAARDCVGRVPLGINPRSST